jgi:hypothetical protein
MLKGEFAFNKIPSIEIPYRPNEFVGLSDVVGLTTTAHRA